MKKLLITLLIIAALLTSGQIKMPLAHGEYEPHDTMDIEAIMLNMTSRLQLTKQQKPEVQVIMLDYITTSKLIRQNMMD